MSTAATDTTHYTDKHTDRPGHTPRAPSQTKYWPDDRPRRSPHPRRHPRPRVSDSFSRHEQYHIPAAAPLRGGLGHALVDGKPTPTPVHPHRLEIVRKRLLETTGCRPELTVIVAATDELGAGHHGATTVGNVLGANSVVKDCRTDGGEATHLAHQYVGIVEREIHQKALEQPDGWDAGVKPCSLKVATPLARPAELGRDDRALLHAQLIGLEQRLLHIKGRLLVNLEDSQLFHARHTVRARVHARPE
mmetsp:Transcript_66635/g.148727  ORF Transcript_66635/g.148727 Transcript_66635/m.148727 type:complete len:248 (-) Transcript_66635:381-1124(-)|eukprot:CAMPEP_0181214100 /NCGR_PEP_ID=MMETSP1096-20121128/25266_1 /TAXON_ID=156174 ORGANISM="Chrysochromulina ericina, Strain CCMP281" /NCGR_SAMPLE_ID=MMETSP1096 /ASSEMBLY_ACC=CAM_ASM_000453 /LENGTH=247 /DNA_ID=CAMNT_0023305799 /DNA_START=212 /DNA_END=955 /DNA_ORIENTATION=-